MALWRPRGRFKWSEYSGRQEAMELVSSIYAAKRMNEGFREAAGKVTGAMEAAAKATAAAGDCSGRSHAVSQTGAPTPTSV